ncbi:MAG TPA: hypothetical protein VER75_09465 [Thermoleophilaceae bacterium]|nr:hypothetical protein [Thermoleophilaceae bacterium]
MKLRLALLVMALLLALAGAESATAASTGPEATAAAKKCKRPKARHKGRCVRRCPAGYVKRRNTRWGRKCVRRTTPNPDPGTQPLFEKPSGELIGQPAFDHFSRYFLNSRFTDCYNGWPACAVEERYDQCSSGAWAYHRYTPTSGADINSYGTYQVTGAVAHPDGSWGVEYKVFAYSTETFYSWDVAADGTVVGRYWRQGNFPPNPPDQNLGPLQWKQPTDCGA